jgi:hypothetical protein
MDATHRVSSRVSKNKYLTGALITIALIGSIHFMPVRAQVPAMPPFSLLSETTEASAPPIPHWISLADKQVGKFNFDVEIVLGGMGNYGKHEKSSAAIQLAIMDASNANNYCAAKNPLIDRGPTKALNRAYLAVGNDCVLLTDHLLEYLTGVGFTGHNPWNVLVSDDKAFAKSVKTFHSLIRTK